MTTRDALPYYAGSPLIFFHPTPHLRKGTPEPSMSSRKSRPSCNHLPTGTLGKVGVIRTANPKKSALGPSNDDNQSRPDDVSTKAGVKIQLKTAEDEVPHKKSVLGPSREESKPSPDDVLDRARFEVRPETAAAEDDAESQYEYYSHMLRREMELRLEKKEAKLAAWYHARYRRKVDDAVAAELKVALSAALQEMNARREIAESETRARLDAEFGTRALEGVSESHHIARIPSNEGVIIMSRLSPGRCVERDPRLEALQVAARFFERVH